ncbi:MAG TPA: hypothetical protein VFN71_13370, partial [Methylomirabilota bacterium]|nr:hypothetical protein [Methylomirabilota bacterium]
MRLLSAPFEPEARGRRNALRPLLPVAGLALGVAAGGWALDLAGAPLGLGRAVAGLGVHGGFLALAWVLVAEGRADWRWPALRLA